MISNSVLVVLQAMVLTCMLLDTGWGNKEEKSAETAATSQPQQSQPQQATSQSQGQTQKVHCHFFVFPGFSHHLGWPEWI